MRTLLWVLLVSTTLAFIHFHDLSSESLQQTFSFTVWAGKSAHTACDQRFSTAKYENKQYTHGQEVKNIKAPAVWGPTMLIP